MDNQTTVKKESMVPKQKSSKEDAIFSIFLTIMGLLVALTPFLQNINTIRLIGILLFVGAILEIVLAFKADSFGNSVLKFLFGGLGMLTGMILIATAPEDLKLMVIVLSAFFLTNGVVEMALATKLRPNKGWPWLFFSGVISIIFGGLLSIGWPIEVIWGMGVYIGIIIAIHGWVIMALDCSS